MEKRKEINNARAIRNGIIFYSNKSDLIGSKTYFNSSGNIQNKIIFKDMEEYIEFFEKNNKVKKHHYVFFNIILIIFSTLLSILLGNFCFLSASLFFSLLASYDFLELVTTSYNMKSKHGKERSTSSFHAAEHMVANAYEALQRIPTIEEVKNFSRFSKKCGSNKAFSKLFFYCMLSIAMCFSYYNIVVYFILLLLILVYMIQAKKHGWLIFLQVFITTKPSDKELKLAIEGLKNFEIMEEEIDKKENIFTMIELPDFFYDSIDLEN